MPSPTRARLPLLLSLAALLLLAVLVARGRSAIPVSTGLLRAAPTTVPRTQHVVPQNTDLGRLDPVLGVGLSVELAIALVALLFGLATAILLLGTIRLRRRRRTTVVVSDDAQGLSVDGPDVALLLRGARSALLRLRRREGGPPGDAVQEAWLALEQAAEESGTARRPEQTSTEFTTALLAAHQVDRAALDTLRGLYQRARFGAADAVTEADAQAAVVALGTIVHTLAAGRVEVTP